MGKHNGILNALENAAKRIAKVVFPSEKNEAVPKTVEKVLSLARKNRLVLCRSHEVLFTSLTLALLALMPAAIAAPEIFTVQGRLTDDNNVALTDTYDMNFYIFDAKTGGNILWSEYHQVAVFNGLFSTVVGDVNTAMRLGSVDFNSPRWLAIEVNTEMQSPRMQIGSAGAALNIDMNALPQPDFNKTYVSYIGGTRDVNINNFGLSAFGDSNFHNVAVSGNLFLGSGITTTGDANFTSIGISSGIFGNWLNLTGDANFMRNVQIQKDLNVWGDLNVAGRIDIQGISFTGGGIRATGDSNFTNVGMTGGFAGFSAIGDANVVNLGISGTLFGGSPLQVRGGLSLLSGDANFYGNTQIQKDLNVWGDLNVAGKIDIQGTSFMGAVTGTSYAIGASTLAASEWGYLDGLDQSLSTTDGVIFDTVDVGAGLGTAIADGTVDTTTVTASSVNTGDITSDYYYNSAATDYIDTTADPWELVGADLNVPSLSTTGSITGPGGETASVSNFKKYTGRTADSLVHFAGSSGLAGTMYLNYGGGTIYALYTPGTSNVNNGQLVLSTLGNLTLTGDINAIGSVQVRKDLNVWGDTNFAGNVQIQGVLFGGSPIEVAGGLKVSGADFNITAGVNRGIGIGSDGNKICFPSNSCEMYIDYNGTAFVFGA